MSALNQRFDRPSEPSPEFNLARYGTFQGLARQSGVEHQGVGEFHRLTHIRRVAFRYLVSTVAAVRECPNLPRSMECFLEMERGSVSRSTATG